MMSVEERVAALFIRKLSENLKACANGVFATHLLGRAYPKA